MSADLSKAPSAAMLSLLSTQAFLLASTPSALTDSPLTGPGPSTTDAPLLDECCSRRHAASASPSSGKAAPLPFIS